MQHFPVYQLSIDIVEEGLWVSVERRQFIDDEIHFGELQLSQQRLHIVMLQFSPKPKFEPELW
jgi:hypothetical protein